MRDRAGIGDREGGKGGYLVRAAAVKIFVFERAPDFFMNLQVLQTATRWVGASWATPQRQGTVL